MCTNLNTPTTTTTTVVLNIECGSILLNGNHEYAEFSLFLFFGDHNFVLCLLLTRFVSVCFVTLYCKDDAKMVPTTPTTKTQTLWITKRYFRFVNLCQNYVHLDVVDFVSCAPIWWCWRNSNYADKTPFILWQWQHNQWNGIGMSITELYLIDFYRSGERAHSMIEMTNEFRHCDINAPAAWLYHRYGSIILRIFSQLSSQNVQWIVSTIGIAVH